MKTVFSGVQPSGLLHLGNYLGSIRNWLNLQDTHHCIFFLADLHTITVKQDPLVLRQNILTTTATYLASGIDPKKTILFCQSAVPQHAELGWILGCYTSLGWLERMTQFKDKGGEEKERVSLGLLSYPVLQAADILLYQADLVPVGEDQKQHLELCRDIASSFNHRHKQKFFKIPEPLIVNSCHRVMSLRDGAKKMSKSDESDYSRINLTDDADLIVKKITKCKTDSVIGITYDKINRREIANLLDIFAALNSQSISKVVDNYQNKTISQFKGDLAEILVNVITPIGAMIKKLCLDDEQYLTQILADGGARARVIAKKNISLVKDICGFIQ